MAGMFDDFMSYLMGGTQMGNMLGIGSPTAATQAPLAVAPGTSPTASGPMLGGAPAGGGGLLGGLLGGQQPVNPASYFMPKPGLLGDSPLGDMLRGAFAGPGAAAGTGGLTGFSNAFQGGGQAIQDRRKQEMAATLAGQQYKSGQQALITGNLQNQLALENANMFRRHFHLPELTMDQLIADPSLATPSVPGATAPGGQAATPTTPATPIDPTILSPKPSITSPTGVVQPRNAIDQFKQATLQFEGSGDPNAIDKKSDAIGGLSPGTFDLYNKKFFGGKLNFANTADRLAVNDQLINDLYQQSGGDVNRMAAAYFTGQMAPPGSPTPWVDPTATDANGVNVVDYVNHIRKNLMLPPIDAGGATAQGQQTAGGQQGGGTQVASTAPAEFDENDPRIPPGMKAALESAYYSRDWGQIAAEQQKISEYLAAPEHAAQTTSATQAATFGGQQAKIDVAEKISDDYKTNKVVTRWGVAKPAADAFQQAYDGRATAGGSSDYSLIVSALQVLNPDGPLPKPGTAEFASQLQTMPGKVEEAITAFFNDKTALPPPVVEQLKNAVDQRMAINQKLITKVNASFADRVKSEAPQIPPSRWNPEGYGLEDQGGQTQTSAKTQWTQDNPATLGAGATADAANAWFDSLPLLSWYKNPADGQILQKLKPRIPKG